MQIVVMLSRSAGNAEVGSMWTDTKVFSTDDSLESVVRWAMSRVHSEYGELLSETLTVQIADE